MKVLMINGSPRKNGCTFTALSEVVKRLEQHDIATQIIDVGPKPVQECVACGRCLELGRCVFDDDQVNETARLLMEADGLVVGSPVYFAGPTGAICSFLNRLFYRRQADYAFKPAAAVVSCRRGGASSSFDRLNKYFTIARMPVVSSQYWNAVHGNTPDEVRQDLEGMQIMRTLGDNMAWMLRNIEAGRIPAPPPETPKINTNFIR